MFHPDNPYLTIVEAESIVPRFIGGFAIQSLDGETRLRMLALRPRLQRCNLLGSGGLFSLPNHPSSPGCNGTSARAWRMREAGQLEDTPTALSVPQALHEWHSTWTLSTRDRGAKSLEEGAHGWMGALLRQPNSDSRIWLLRPWGSQHQTVEIGEYFDGSQQLWRVTLRDADAHEERLEPGLTDAFITAEKLVRARQKVPRSAPVRADLHACAGCRNAQVTTRSSVQSNLLMSAHIEPIRQSCPSAESVPLCSGYAASDGTSKSGSSVPHPTDHQLLTTFDRHLERLLNDQQHHAPISHSLGRL